MGGETNLPNPRQTIHPPRAMAICCNSCCLFQSTPSTRPPIRATAWATRNARTGPRTCTRRARIPRPAKTRTRSPSISTSIGSQRQPGRARSSRARTSGSRSDRTPSRPPLKASTSWASAMHAAHPPSYNNDCFLTIHLLFELFSPPDVFPNHSGAVSTSSTSGRWNQSPRSASPYSYPVIWMRILDQRHIHFLCLFPHAIL